MVYILQQIWVQSKYDQWWKETKYIYSDTVLKYNFEVLVLYLSICFKIQHIVQDEISLAFYILQKAVCSRGLISDVYEL